MLIEGRMLPEFAHMPSQPTGLETLDPEDLPAARSRLRARFEAAGPIDPQVAIETVSIASEGRTPVAVRVLRPRADSGPLPALLWIHGGGHMLGSAAMDDLRLGELIRAVPCVAVSVEYRLAPEHPYPAAMDDCLAALEWLRAEHARLGIQADRVALGGVSAGGGVAAGLALRLRDEGRISPIQLLLMAPMLDDRPEAAGRGAVEDVWAWNGLKNAMGWRAYLGKHRYSAPVYAVPARALDLKGLPPTFIAIGALDHFLAENLAFAQALHHDGVEIDVQVVPGAPHGFEMATFKSPLASRARAAAITAFERAVACA